MKPSDSRFHGQGGPLQPPGLRGRAAEIALVSPLVDGLDRGHGGVVVIEGPPGIGKSRLLEEIGALARTAGVRTLLGQAFEYQRTVPFFALMMATVQARPPIVDAESLRSLGTSTDVRYWVLHELHAAIEAASKDQPLVILLEDVHWADNATLLALRTMTARIRSRVLWVISARTGVGGRAVGETLAAFERDGAVVVRLDAVTAGAIADITEDAIQARAAPALLDLAAKTHGNPFLLMELLRGLHDERRLKRSAGQVTVTGDALPRRLTIGMQQRLDELSDAASEVIRIASVLPDRFSATTLAAVIGRPPTALASAIDQAVRSDLLVEDEDRLRFRHHLLREATRQSMPQSLRRAMERQAVTAMLDAGAAPQEVATQLARSAEVGDRTAVAALRQAVSAVADADPSTAADLSMQILDLLGSHDPERGTLVAETVVLLNRAARYDQARTLAAYTLSAALPADEEAAIRLRLVAITRDTTQQRINDNRRVLALTDISEVMKARNLSWLAYNEAIHGQDPQDTSALEEATTAAMAVDDPESTILCETTRSVLECAAGYPGAAIHRMEQLQQITRRAEGTPADDIAAYHVANLLAFAGRSQESLAVTDFAIQSLAEERNDMLLQIATTQAALSRMAAGEITQARTAIDMAPPPDRPATTVLAIARTVIVADIAGRVGDQKLLQEALIRARAATESSSPATRRDAAAILALAAWNRGDLHDAMRWLAGDIPLLTAPVLSYFHDHLILSARVASAAGDAGLRARVLTALDTLGREQPRLPLVAAVCQYAQAILDRDPDTVLAAGEQINAHGRPLLYACAAQDAARELKHVGRTPEAVEALKTAFDTLAERGAVADARLVGRELRGLGVTRRLPVRRHPRTGWDSLTDTEIKVAHLITQDGATSRSVADTLHLSPHTVKTHVRNIFAKLRIRSRAELAHTMRGRAG
ncbi:AAA family ATPase [Mycobacterium sp. 21AC1]|uniref:helix-turn-helix transcriptional regulator n=1 Tax=[Mycobacterium] appelbergii TaxID=2939269 RepID=UPI0029390F7C|nr:AAA family ATPase [Mycobacterium sp. 21AC1]MDV3128207.1 AAA family ATPase [Mycobacterium sp. 21AC1]